MEALAEAAHESWSGWMDWQFSLAENASVDAGGVGVGLPLLMTVRNYERWNRKRATGYAELAEKERQSGRLEAMRYWPAFAAAWIEANVDGRYGPPAADLWRAEMGMGDA